MWHAPCHIKLEFICDSLCNKKNVGLVNVDQAIVDSNKCSHINNKMS